jgi:RND family efflux transporter MFP subunit
LVLLLLGAAADGCRRPEQRQNAPSAPEVEVSTPEVRQITDFEEYTGQTQAVKTITIRARVSGYLDKVLFKEGADVKQGDPLFEIDRRTYQADYDRTVANLAQAKAHLVRLEADFKRAASLLPKAAIAQADYDLAAGDRAEAEAAVEVAGAAMHTAKLNLDFTIVTAPISGRISRQLIDPGNLAKADDTPLTTIVSLDPMYAYFDVDERTMLRIRRLIASGEIRSAQDSEIKVYMELADEHGFPHEGTVNFIDNQVDLLTGTLRLRGLFHNPYDSQHRMRILAPGLFARIRVPVGDAHQALLVSERALGSDQGQKFLYVVGADNKALYRHVEVGALRDGLQVITRGLESGERVVLSGLQRIRSGDKVTPKAVPMTSRDVAPAAAAPEAASVAKTAPAAASAPGGKPDSASRPPTSP